MFCIHASPCLVHAREFSSRQSLLQGCVLATGFSKIFSFYLFWCMSTKFTHGSVFHKSSLQPFLLVRCLTVDKLMSENEGNKMVEIVAWGPDRLPETA